VSYTFGPDVVDKFLAKHDLELVCRAHQVVEDGYEFFAKRSLVTIFSAPNYCGEFDNAGAMMSVDESLLCSFQVSFTYPLSLDRALTQFVDSQASAEEAKVQRVARSFSSQTMMIVIMRFVEAIAGWSRNTAHDCQTTSSPLLSYL
jgi:hypothetical protein